MRACLVQTEVLNVGMGIGMFLFRTPLVSLFIDRPTAEIITYSNGYLTAVAPCYLILGLLLVYRTAIQSMQNTIAPFLACMIELAMRIASTTALVSAIGYTGVCIASPLAWAGATVMLIPVYYVMLHRRNRQHVQFQKKMDAFR